MKKRPNRLLEMVLVCGMLGWGTLSAAAAQTGRDTYQWKSYRPTNTGIQGDMCEALVVGADGNPWIAGYDASFEEGGFARYQVANDRWYNFSNVDFSVLGNPELTGISRVSDIARDANGDMWMATGRGGLFFSPKVGAKSIVRFGADNSPIHGGWNRNVEVAPDGTIWFASYSTVWGNGGVCQYDPKNKNWLRVDEGIGDSTLAIQPRAGGGYYVWTGMGGGMQRYDSLTRTWDTLAPEVDEPAFIVGKNVTDSQGNSWFFRWTNPDLFESRLDCMRPDGSWMDIPEPPFGVFVQGIRAKTATHVLAIDGSGGAWNFNGTSWTSLGSWNDSIVVHDIDQDSAGNVWMCGDGGAAKRDAATGEWQRYRVTNTSQYDFFNEDLTIDSNGIVYATANAAPGVGGMVSFDGERWTGYNQLHYGLGQDWPFETDNSQRVYVRPKSAQLLVNPTFAGLHRKDSPNWVDMQAPDATIADIRDDGLGRLWVTTSIGTYLRKNNVWEQVLNQSGKEIRLEARRANGKILVFGDTTIHYTNGQSTQAWAIEDFPELDPTSDQFKGVVIASNGIIWIGANTINLPDHSTVIKLNPVTGQHTTYRAGVNWPFPGQYVMPVIATADGRVWFQYDSDFGIDAQGLGFMEGNRIVKFPSPPQGQFRWGGLPHAGILDVEQRETPDGYQLWMCCASRGIAVLTVRKAQPQ